MSQTLADILQGLKWDRDNLIPAIVQDGRTKRVLTLAYMNSESLQKTWETRETWFYSRSRQHLWHEGETSGHTQRVMGLEVDCDGDALLVFVEPQGPACHTGTESCFDTRVALPFEDPAAQGEGVLERLEQRVAKRDRERPEGAYTTYLFSNGIDKILKKVGEETAEVIIAAKNRSASELRYETADLLYHLFVMLREQKLPFAEVLAELEERYQGKKTH